MHVAGIEPWFKTGRGLFFGLCLGSLCAAGYSWAREWPEPFPSSHEDLIQKQETKLNSGTADFPFPRSYRMKRQDRPPRDSSAELPLWHVQTPAYRVAGTGNLTGVDFSFINSGLNQSKLDYPVFPIVMDVAFMSAAVMGSTLVLVSFGIVQCFCIKNHRYWLPGLRILFPVSTEVVKYISPAQEVGEAGGQASD